MNGNGDTGKKITKPAFLIILFCFIACAGEPQGDKAANNASLPG